MIIPINMHKERLIKGNNFPSAQECIGTIVKPTKTTHPGTGMKGKLTEDIPPGGYESNQKGACTYQDDGGII